MFHKFNRSKYFPNSTKVEVHSSHISQWLRRPTWAPGILLALSYTLILIPLFWSHLHMSWSSTFRSNAIRRESLTNSQPPLHRQTSNLHKELPLWLINYSYIVMSHCQLYTGRSHLYVACWSVCDRDQDIWSAKSVLDRLTVPRSWRATWAQRGFNKFPRPSPFPVDLSSRKVHSIALHRPVHSLAQRQRFAPKLWAQSSISALAAEDRNKIY